MNPPPNSTLTNSNDPLAGEPADDYLREDLHCAVSLIEDWLLHASPETLDELGDFVYGPNYRRHDGHDGHDQLRWIVELLGVTAVRLRPAATQTATRQATTDPATNKGRRG